MKAVYTIVNDYRRQPSANPDRKVWVRIGSADVTKDGSINVVLDALPVNGTLHIRDVPEPIWPVRGGRSEDK